MKTEKVVVIGLAVIRLIMDIQMSVSRITYTVLVGT